VFTSFCRPNAPPYLCHHCVLSVVETDQSTTKNCITLRACAHWERCAVFLSFFNGIERRALASSANLGAISFLRCTTA
jgi:hypothetical protein